MPQKFGPGLLKFGDTGSEMEFASQCSKVEIDPELSDEDAITMLDLSEFKPEGDVSGKITGTFHQDYSMAGLVAWCWQHAGDVVKFVFRPSDKTSDMVIEGQCQIKPVKVGGDPNKYNTADFEFPLVGSELPTMSAASGPPSGP